MPTPAHDPTGASRATSGPSRPTGLLLATAGVLAGVGSIILSVAFDWPASLDDRAATALPAFAAEATTIRLGFYLQLVSSLVLIPAAIGLERLLVRSALTRALTVLGLAGAMVQMLGWVRWPLVVPVLARDYLAAAPGSPERAAVGASYDLLNAYAGGALGEHLGWLLQGIWALGIGLLLASGRLLPRGFAAVGPALAIGWLPLVLAAGFTASHTTAVFTIGSLGHALWFIWLTAAGIVLAVRPRSPLRRAMSAEVT